MTLGELVDLAGNETDAEGDGDPELQRTQSMVYDPRRGRAVLIGQGTWELPGADFLRASPAQALSLHLRSAVAPGSEVGLRSLRARWRAGGAAPVVPTRTLEGTRRYGCRGPREVRERLATPGRATLVVGPRQAGKSTWAWQELRRLDPALLLVNCEEPLVRTWLTSPGLVLADLEETFGAQVRRLLLEEVQHLADAGLLVKGLVDRRTGLSVVVTGSASFHLGGETRESLAGRAGYLTLYPFSLDEVCQDLTGLPPGLSRLRRQERFERHVVTGGYPAAWCSPTPELVLADLVTAFLLRDASDLFRIERPDAFQGLLRLGGRRARVSRSLRSFVEAYRPEAVLLVSASGPTSGAPEELTETGLPVAPLHVPARDVARHVGAWASPATGPVQ